MPSVFVCFSITLPDTDGSFAVEGRDGSESRALWSGHNDKSGENVG
jgi:hypothetical protein